MDGLMLSIKSWRVAWTITFLVNLPLPLFFGVPLTNPDGTIGIAAALGVMYICGLFATMRANRWVRGALYGSVVTAFGQFVVILHMFSGFAAISIWNWVSGANVDILSGNLDFLDAFVVSLVTASILLLVALACGVFYLWMVGGFRDEPVVVYPEGTW